MSSSSNYHRLHVEEILFWFADKPTKHNHDNAALYSTYSTDQESFLPINTTRCLSLNLPSNMKCQENEDTIKLIKALQEIFIKQKTER